MALPKSTEDNISLSQEDLRYTDDMKKLTVTINSQLKNQENEVSRFLSHFQAFRFWVEQNKDRISNLRELILEKIDLLEEHAAKSQTILESIRLMTQDEEKLVSKKLMISIEVGEDFASEERFVQRLDFPRGVAELAKDVARIFRQEKDEMQEDLKIESKTEDLLSKTIQMMQNIRSYLSTFRTYARESADLSAIKPELDKMVSGVEKELMLLRKLSELEGMHLHILLEIYDQEMDAIGKETQFRQNEERIGKSE
jgi:hypothetical protein